MQILSRAELEQHRCEPCRDGAVPCSQAQAEKQLEQLAGWKLVDSGRRIRRDWKVKNFLAGLEFFRLVGEAAEDAEHHPDLHLENYRDVAIEIWTHSIGGLSVNDFSLAAKIDAIAGSLSLK